MGGIEILIERKREYKIKFNNKRFVKMMFKDLLI